MPPNAYEVFQELEREEQFAPQEGKTQASYSTWRERAMSRNMRRGFLVIGTCWLLYFVYLNRLYATWMPSYSGSTDQATTDADIVATTPAQNKVEKLVPLDVHVMSKCPDARDCLQKLIIPAMEKISDKVDFQLSFIGR
jgi:Gamma interferon inducible lysosomal thiol reductase (GILT)